MFASDCFYYTIIELFWCCGIVIVIINNNIGGILILIGNIHIQRLQQCYGDQKIIQRVYTFSLPPASQQTAFTTVLRMSSMSSNGLLCLSRNQRQKSSTSQTNLLFSYKQFLDTWQKIWSSLNISNIAFEKSFF